MINRHSRGRRLAAVQKSRQAISHVHTEVSLVCDQQDTGTVMNVAVIMDVDQKVVLHRLFLNPAVEDLNEVVQPDRRRIGHEEFDPKPMNFHYGFPTDFIEMGAEPRSVRESWRLNRYCANLLPAYRSPRMLVS